MDEEVLLIEALPVVRSLMQLGAVASKGGGFQASLWCHAGRETEGSCGKKQEPPVHMSQSRTTLLDCLRELRGRLETRHANCIPAAEQAQQASRSAASSSSAGCGAGCDCTQAGVDRFQAMMRMESTRKRASEANVLALAAEKAREAAELEVAVLERLVDPKKPRADDEETGAHKALDDWDLADHRREMTRVMNRRKIRLGANESVRDLRTGKEGYLEHARLGLIGAVSYWAVGSMAVAVTILVALIVKLKLVDRVRAALPQSKAERDAETNAAIADLLEQVCVAV
eukprot:1286640-Prymnesium_polylepis.2